MGIHFGTAWRLLLSGALLLLPSCASRPVLITERNPASEVACESLHRKEVPAGTICKTGNGGRFQMVHPEDGINGFWRDLASGLLLSPVWGGSGSGHQYNQHRSVQHCLSTQMPDSNFFWRLPTFEEGDRLTKAGLNEISIIRFANQYWTSIYDRNTPLDVRAAGVFGSSRRGVHTHHSSASVCIASDMPKCSALNLRNADQVPVGTQCRSGPGGFALVRREASGKELWRDLVTGYLWTDELDGAFLPAEAEAACSKQKFEKYKFIVPLQFGVHQENEFDGPNENAFDTVTAAAQNGFAEVLPNMKRRSFLVQGERQLQFFDVDSGKLAPAEAESRYPVRCFGWDDSIE